jgi:hypothetical protein
VSGVSQPITARPYASNKFPRPHTNYPQRLPRNFETNFIPPDCRVDDNHDNLPFDNRSPLTAEMGRLHSKGKGISASAIPYSRNAPSWLKTTPEQVVDQICKLAKKGATPSQIGVVLRDSHGVAQVKLVTGMRLSSNTRQGFESLEQMADTFTGNRILRILKGNGMR